MTKIAYIASEATMFKSGTKVRVEFIGKGQTGLDVFRIVRVQGASSSCRNQDIRVLASDLKMEA